MNPHADQNRGHKDIFTTEAQRTQSSKGNESVNNPLGIRWWNSRPALSSTAPSRGKWLVQGRKTVKRVPTSESPNLPGFS